MVDVVLFQQGPIPDYIKDCIKQIKFWSPSAIIHLISDHPFSFQDVIDFDLISLESFPSVQAVINTQYFQHEKNPLWRTSALRFAYIQAYMELFGLKDVIHFDNDVMIYCDLEDVAGRCRVLSMRNAITPCNRDLMICGFCYFSNLTKINEQLSIFMEMSHVRLEGLAGSMPNEMRLLGLIRDMGYINDLPILPSSLDAGEFGLFDSAAYGQYLGGTCNGHSPGWAEDHHYIGKEILRGNIEVFFDGKPFVRDLINNEVFSINNLHVHSKNLKAFSNV
jgi:hypothetical protein